MDIEKLKANAPEGTQYANASSEGAYYYRAIGGFAEYYNYPQKDWAVSRIYTAEDLLSDKFIDLRETAPVWTPENNTLPFGELTREQKIAMFAAWVDGCDFESSKSISSSLISITNPGWHSDFVYIAKKSPRTAFIEKCESLSAAEIYDAIKSGKLKVEKGE